MEHHVTETLWQQMYTNNLVIEQIVQDPVQQTVKKYVIANDERERKKMNGCETGRG